MSPCPYAANEPGRKPYPDFIPYSLETPLLTALSVAFRGALPPGDIKSRRRQWFAGTNATSGTARQWGEDCRSGHVDSLADAIIGRVEK